ncbi:MAG: ribosome-associated translation inhibitor RaiA [Anaerolineaceae bacterium]|nr:ribosome-associated translation inhibitor RaiA [Anaerolineaceae bacterium]MBN2677230.1 ribosome-associated translation inhibitor RaiA [Anaerolineaceae bacterium]
MSVKIDIFAKNMEISDRINDYVTDKVSKLDRFLPDIDEVRVDLSYLKTARSASDRQVAQITIRGKRGYILRTEERSEDLYMSFDRALDKLQRKIERYKGKRERNRGDGTTAAEVVAVVHEGGKKEMEPDRIIRRKHFKLIPMDEQEALEQMKLLSHEDFFIFYNVNTRSVNVLYLRRDGAYGLIETEIE